MKTNKKDAFIQLVEDGISAIKAHPAMEFDPSVYADALAYFEAFKNSIDKASNKPKFTDNGKLILQYLKDNEQATQNMFKSREVAEGIFISSKSVSGSMRKLVNDGFVEKIGQDPIIYALTDAGREVVIED